jgi:Uma2 family endonuclease
MAAGTVVWVIDPELQRVEVYVSGQPPKALNVDEMLDGGAALPGFSLPLSVIFAE